MISVIVPAYNAKKTIFACLSALENQTVPRTDYEVVVIDDGSTDDTVKIIEGFPKVRVISQENQGPAAARNKGANCAEGEIIIFTDSDCEPQPDWIEQMIAPFEREPDIAGVKGAYKTRQPEWAARFVQLEYEDKYDLLAQSKYIDFIDTYAAAFRKRVFLQFGGYDTSFPVACAEDIELTYRMSSQGCKMVFNPKAIVSHTHPNTFLSYFKKKYKFAYWRMLALRKNPNKILKDSHTPQIMKLQALFLPAILGALPFAIFLSAFRALEAFIIVAFFLSTIPFTMKAYRKDKTIGILSPILLTARSVAQSAGIINGALHKVIMER